MTDEEQLIQDIERVISDLDESEAASYEYRASVYDDALTEISDLIDRYRLQALGRRSA